MQVKPQVWVRELKRMKMFRPDLKEKQSYDKDKLVSVTMMKGEGLDYSNKPHQVDGMSGATLTGKGVNNMLKDYLLAYENYMKKNKKN